MAHPRRLSERSRTDCHGDSASDLGITRFHTLATPNTAKNQGKRPFVLSKPNYSMGCTVTCGIPVPPVDRRATQPGDDRQPCDPSPTVDRRPEAGEQPTLLLIQDGDQLIDGPMLLDDGASPASLAIGATADMDGSVIGLGLHGSPPSFERKEANRL